MYWKGLWTKVQSHVKKCQSCQGKMHKTQTWETASKTCNDHPLGGIMCGPYGTVYPQEQGQDTNWLYVHQNDWPFNQLIWNCWIPSIMQRLDIPMCRREQKGKDTPIHSKQPYFDKTLATVGKIINRTWFSHYPHSQYSVYDNGSKFKLHFTTLCDSYGLKHKPTSVRNPQANAIHKWAHQTITAMLCTAEQDMADTVRKTDIANFLTNTAWDVHFTYHKVVKTLPGTEIFGWDMLFDVPCLANCTKIGEYRQKQTDNNTRWENSAHVNWD